MREVASFKNADLVLKVTSNIDPTVFDALKYEGFLDALYGTREYAKDAVRAVCNYLMGGAYRDQEDLAEKNWRASSTLKDKYPTFARFKTNLPFPDRLACSVDLATGTGKSFVEYGIARIMLAEGVVDRVLVLCPSNTIEAGLTEKFRELSGRRDLIDLIGDNAVLRNPHIINASESITLGDICIENIHATYKNTRSAIRDSLIGNGDRTLVLNDEAHHIYSPTDQSLKKWKEFLDDSNFNFRFIVGFSGTSYIGNDYFPDTVTRYSVATALEQGFIKSIEYIAEDSSGDQYEKLQKIYDNHLRAKKLYPKLRPLTIFVTKDVTSCKKLADDLIIFLAKQENLSRDDAARKILPVTSNKDHVRNVARLLAGEPDEQDSLIEWITSVSMLTEGWDVKNVFQIVPHEKRAFDSKLLIAQVLGRGLRVPEAYAGTRPTVIVFNHDNWSSSIRHLVDEVLEIERRISCFPIQKPTNYNFAIHTIDYEKTEDVVETEQDSEYNFTMERVELATQQREVHQETTYEKAVSGDRRTQKNKVVFEMIPVEDIVLQIFNKFKAVDMESGSRYARLYPKDKIRQLIRNSLDYIGYGGDELSKENRQRVLSKFGTLSRRGNKSIRYNLTPAAVKTIQAVDRSQDSMNIAALRRGASIFYDDLSFVASDDIKQLLKEIENDESLPRSASKKIENSFHFRTCLSVALASAEPERKFITQLTKQENASKITAWLKNSDVGFYEIEYSFLKGEKTKRSKFNPDFFVKIGEDILVVEIKDDSEVIEPSAENRGKYRAAKQHFDTLNELQTEAKYHFCFLTPKGYDIFFSSLREGNHMTFRSDLDVALLDE